MQQALWAEKKLDGDTLIIGGAFRYTYMKNSWDETHDNTGGRAIFDVLILSAKGQLKGIEFAV